MSFHDESVGENNHAITANPNSTGASYADIAARDADTDFNTDSGNFDKVVRVEDPLSLFWLVASGTFVAIGSTEGSTFLELIDTPGSYSGQAGFVLQSNVAETAVEFGQALRDSDVPEFLGLGIGIAIPEGTVHIETSAVAGGVNPNSQADDLIVENNDHVGMTLFAPDDRFSTIVFGSPGGTGNEGARIRWDPALDLFTIATTQATSNILFAAGITNPTMFIKSTGEVGIGTVFPDPASILDLTSTTRGFLPPRMTETERDAIVSPVVGLVIYNLTNSLINVFNGTIWIDSMSAGDVSGPVSSTDNAVVRFDGATGKVIKNSGVTIDNSNAMIVPALFRATTGAIGLQARFGQGSIGFGHRYIVVGEDSSITGTKLSFDTEFARGFLSIVGNDNGEQLSLSASGQVGVGVGNVFASFAPSAKFQVTSTTQGLLLPRMSEVQRDAISLPTAGLIIFNLTSDAINIYNGTEWRQGSTTPA